MSWPERWKCHTIHWLLSVSGTKTSMFWWRLDEILAPCCPAEPRAFLRARSSTWTAPLAGFPAALAGETLGWGAEPGPGSGAGHAQPSARRRGSHFERVVIWSEWHLKSLTWSRRATMLLLAFELQSLFWFCTEIRAAETAAAAVLVVVLAQCKSAKDSCSLHTLRACCCFTHSHLHRGRHQQGGSGSHDYPSTMEISHRYVLLLRANHSFVCSEELSV